MDDELTDKELWPPMADAIKRAGQPMLEVAWDDEGVRRTLRVAFRTHELRQDTLHVLAQLPTEYTVELLDDVIGQALALRDLQRVMRLLGRLSYRQAREIVPPAVWRLLEAEENNPNEPIVYDAWRRMAEVLDYLGLYDALRELCDKARDSIDPDVREVAEDYAPDDN